MGLFTGFSVISGIELLYWIIFKVIEKTENRGLKITFLPRQVFFHKKDVESSDGEDKKELGWRERRSQNDEDSEVSNFNKPSTSWERIIYTFNKKSTSRTRSFSNLSTKVSSDKEDVEAGPAPTKPKSSSCCSSCQALKSTAKLEAMEAEIAEMKMAMKVCVHRSSQTKKVM